MSVNAGIVAKQPALKCTTVSSVINLQRIVPVKGSIHRCTGSILDVCNVKPHGRIFSWAKL
jgi:hypothetical protein